MTPTAPAEQVVREVVRGERPWTDLRALGMDIRPEEGTARDVRYVDVLIDAYDLARGFASLLHDPAALREWAFAMQALDVEFLPTLAHPSGEDIWDAVWDASFGHPLEEAQVRFIEGLAREGRSES